MQGKRNNLIYNERLNDLSDRSQKEKNPSSPSGSPPESTSGIPAIIGQLPKGIFEIDQSRFSGDNVAKLDMLVSKRHSSISLICWEYVGNVSLSSG
jgi:hypothetical protein